jgi:hypothetical protein
MALSLSAVATTAAQAAVSEEAGPFWPGNLLSMNNADFENGAGDWVKSNDVSTLTTSPTAFLHNDSLEIVATGPGTSIINLSGASGVKIDLPGTGNPRTFRVGAYINMKSTNSHQVEFDLHCYNSAGHPIAWEDGTAVSFLSNGNWHWVENDITVPSGCASVQDSPQMQFTKMHAGGTIYLDEAWFAPERAALMIGAFAPPSQSSPTPWQTDDANIGPLQSEKVFFGGNSPALPGRWESSRNPCHKIMQGSGRPAEPPVCVVNLNPPPDSSGVPVYSETQIRDFFTGMPTGQTVIMVYHGQPEGKSFSGCPGPTDAAKFISCFEQEAANIRDAAASPSLALTENVFTADDSASFEYVNKGAGMSPKCGWIVPPSAADFYVEDHYERGWAGDHDLAQQSSSKGAQEWNNWLGCVDTYANTLDKPIGLAEYGLCSGSPNKEICSPNQGCGKKGDAGSTPADTRAMNADKTYLSSQPSGVSPTLLWEYWYDKCWEFTDSGGKSEWQAIENQNGGAVGG